MRVEVTPADVAAAVLASRAEDAPLAEALQSNADLARRYAEMQAAKAAYMAPPLSSKLQEYLANTPDLQSPCVVIDVDMVEANYRVLASSIPCARIFYAVKANPADDIVSRIASLGGCFDTASMGEIDLVLSHGVTGDRISYGNTIKKEAHIAEAYAKGVRLYAFDSISELEKIARAAPGSKVMCRVLMACEGAEWPLSRKFGCEPSMATDLLVRAKELGLVAHGISFHVGSQQTDLSQYDLALTATASLFSDLASRGVELGLINLGGGFPTVYRTDVPPVPAYGAAIMASLKKHFGEDLPEIIIEPGRGMVGNAGVLQAEVVLVSQKGGSDNRRWVYLDVGKFHGLAETMDESIKYRIETPHDGIGDTAPVVLAGPTCDSADIMYEKATYEMPVALKAGDKVRIRSTGAYTTTYSAVGFNGFPPLASVCI